MGLGAGGFIVSAYRCSISYGHFVSALGRHSGLEDAVPNGAAICGPSRGLRSVRSLSPWAACLPALVV